MTRSQTSPARAALAVIPLAAIVGLALAPHIRGVRLEAQEAGPLGSPIPGLPLGQPADAAGPIAFLPHQLTFERVAAARDSADDRLRAAFAETGVPYPAAEIFLRVFKHERVLELWARSRPEAPFTLVKAYPVCSLPGQLGPKRQMGDVQVPEGFYFIDQFNPRSDFHLSLRLNYPNVADRMRREALALGGDIFIHGGCATVGCVPIEDRNIEEVYWAAVQATDAGQRLIPVHVFPARLDPDNLRWLEATFSPDPELLAFWRNLAQGYRYFEETRRVPWVTVAADGSYAVPPHTAVATTPAPADLTAASDSTAVPDSATASPASGAATGGLPGGLPGADSGP